MKNLTKEQLILLVKGSSWYGTGGGFPLREQLQRIEQNECDHFELISCDELNRNSLVVCAYGLGSSANTNIDLTAAFNKAFELAQELTKQACSAIFPAEPNIETSIFSIAQKVGLPVLDADTCGGRAVPELCFDNFTLLNRSVAPIIACNMNLDCKVIKEYQCIDTVENELRSFAQSSPGGSIAVIDHLISAAEAKTYLTLGSLGRSLELGKDLEKYARKQIAKNDLFERYQAEVILAQAIVLSSNLESKSGFFQGDILLQCAEKKYNVRIKNELLAVREAGAAQYMTCAPDLLVPLDIYTLYGLHSTQLVVNQELMLLKIPASNLWQSQAAVDLFETRLCD